MLVMTSGNPSGAPICHNDAEAQEALAPLCDVILSHDRRIRLRADDSVMDWFEGKPYMVRRSRGFAPLPFMLSAPLKGQVLGIGGELKNTFCLASNHLFYPSPYIGDMSDLRTMLALKDSVQLMESLLENKPAAIACDLHPRYNTVTVAEELAKKSGAVQHHYAHILSCMAENDWEEPVIGIAFDGTGYGTDGTIWGGEVLVSDVHGFQRSASIQPFWQRGGDASAREGWRIAVSLIDSLQKDRSQAASMIEALHLCSEAERQAQFFLADQQINSVLSTSAGRLFDGISAILGICRASTFEGQASMALQFAAEAWEKDRPAPDVTPMAPIHGQERLLLPTGVLVRQVLEGRLAGEAAGCLAYAFHRGLAAMIAGACLAVQEETGLHAVALSGGVFQNTLLTRLTKERLERAGFRVLLHSLLPPNDGGICVGQAAFAMYALQES